MKAIPQELKRRVRSRILQNLFFISITLAVPLAVLANSQKDTLFMKDHSIRVGIIMSQDSLFTHIKTDYDNLVISNDDIVRIGYRAEDNLLMPDIGIQLSGGMAFPSQFDFASDVGVRAGVRYMIAKSVGLYASLTYATWQTNFDTTLPTNTVKETNPPITETYSITALSPRIGAFIVAPLSKKSQMMLGFDIGQTFVSINDQDSSVGPNAVFSYSLRLDFRFAFGESLALLLGMQYENFSTIYDQLEEHNFVSGSARRIGDIMLSGGFEFGL